MKDDQIANAKSELAEYDKNEFFHKYRLTSEPTYVKMETTEIPQDLRLLRKPRFIVPKTKLFGDLNVEFWVHVCRCLTVTDAFQYLKKCWLQGLQCKIDQSTKKIQFYCSQSLKNSLDIIVVRKKTSFRFLASVAALEHVASALGVGVEFRPEDC